MKITSKITLHFKTVENADTFVQSFTPELEDIPMKRSTIEVEELSPGEKDVCLLINAEDPVAYRASITNLVQSADLVEKTIQMVEKESKG